MENETNKIEKTLVAGKEVWYKRLYHACVNAVKRAITVRDIFFFACGTLVASGIWYLVYNKLMWMFTFMHQLVYNGKLYALTEVLVNTTK